MEIDCGISFEFCLGCENIPEIMKNGVVNVKTDKPNTEEDVSEMSGQKKAKRIRKSLTDVDSSGPKKSTIKSNKSTNSSKRLRKDEMKKMTKISTLESYESLGPGPKRPLALTGKIYMGSHVSGAGGIWNAFKNADQCESKSFALFLRSQRQWNAKPLEEETVKKWKEAAKNFPPHLILPHGSYLMNLGSPKDEILEKSRSLLVEELQRCDRLGIPNYNFHPGSSLGQITQEECCEIIAESINLAHEKTKLATCVIENMCGQGFTVGGDFKEIRHIIANVKDKSRVGVCIDTCHAHAAGYDLSSQEGFDSLLEDFEKIIGWQFLCGLHINDSKGKSGDHKDRHENIGKGTIGIDGFRRIINCHHFTDLPLILETPYTSDEMYAKEVRILEKLSKLV